MIQGDIFYGDINITLVKVKKQRGTNKVINIDRHNFRMNRLVFTMHDGKVVMGAGHAKERIKRKLPHHLQNYDITNVTYLGGEKVGETQYDISDVLN